MPKPRRRKHQLLAIVDGRAVCVTELLSLEMARVEAEVLPAFRALGARGELDAWFASNAVERAGRELARVQRRNALVARCYAELRTYQRSEAQS